MPPVTVFRPVLTPEVAESVTVLRVPAVTPTVLLRGAEMLRVAKVEGTWPGAG
jgi:hypothetical protein